MEDSQESQENQENENFQLIEKIIFVWHSKNNNSSSSNESYFMACMALHQNNFVSTYSHFNFLEKWEVEIRVEDLNEQDKKIPFISKRKTSKSKLSKLFSAFKNKSF